MAGVGDLPAELVLMILRFAVGEPAATLRGWRARLPLLAVCRQWRRLACRLVHGQALVERRAGGGWGSNLGLAAALGLEGCVRHLVLDAQAAATGAVVRAHPRACAAVQSLAIRGGPDDCAAAADGGGGGAAAAAAAAHGGDASSALSGLAALLPSVTRLYVGTCAGAVGGRLADALAGQLCRIGCQAPVALQCARLAGGLTHLSLALGRGPGGQLPRVCAPTLRVLRLARVPPRFAWGAFGGSDICFERLVELQLLFRSPAPEDDGDDGCAAPPPRLRFPRLRRCHVEGCPPHGAPFAAAQLPAAMDSLTLAGAPEAALALSRTGLARVGALAVRVQLAGADQRALYGALDRLYGQVRVAGEAALALAHRRAELDLGCAAWPRVTRLSIHGPCDLAAVAGLVERAACLRRLEVYALALDRLPAAVAMPDPADDAAPPLPPLPSRIETLTLYADADADCAPPAAAAAAAVRCLLLRLPLLKRANLSGALGVHPAALGRAFGRRYPHIAAALVKVY
ncbi:hypothetical protein H4R18_000795 [Coemansia javaensis]|uniref:F-box domain-containing protein n=1 Tax=Coemansia javaensis TaxID=2761396 RepID=A0A9W8LLM0_9FUNG|nr:hypothetical protein H4R18_000795 [Coemansia javaensis]